MTWNEALLPREGELAEHLRACPGCAAEWEADRSAWSALESYGAPEIGEATCRRISANLSAALVTGAASRRRWWTGILGGWRPAASGASGWAAVGAAVLLGLGAGGWLGLGLKGLLAEEPGGAELPPAPAGLLEVADLVFDVAPPGSPASAWFGHGLEGEVR